MKLDSFHGRNRRVIYRLYVDDVPFTADRTPAQRLSSPQRVCRPRASARVATTADRMRTAAIRQELGRPARTSLRAARTHLCAGLSGGAGMPSRRATPPSATAASCSVRLPLSFASPASNAKRAVLSTAAWNSTGSSLPSLAYRSYVTLSFRLARWCIPQRVASRLRRGRDREPDEARRSRRRCAPLGAHRDDTLAARSHPRHGIEQLTRREPRRLGDVLVVAMKDRQARAVQATAPATARRTPRRRGLQLPVDWLKALASSPPSGRAHCTMSSTMM